MTSAADSGTGRCPPGQRGGKGPAGFVIRPMLPGDLPLVTEWARREDFCPGPRDVSILRHVDRGGAWVGCLDGRPIGCIVGARHDERFGFIGLFLVCPEQRGQGYGLALWRRAMEHLADVACIGLEAAPDRVDDYAGWGFRRAHDTVRWRLAASSDPLRPRPLCQMTPLPHGYRILPAPAVPETVVAAYDARHEATPRPMFLREWLRPTAPGDAVLVVLDELGCCRGFARIRPALPPRPQTVAWRLGPWLADSRSLAGVLLDRLCGAHGGAVLVDTPEPNPRARRLLEERGFVPSARTVRMYRGVPPSLPLHDIYGLACLELG